MFSHCPERRISVKKYLALSAFALFVITIQVMAQEETAIEEILVTAQKREQSIQDVPLSVGVLSEETLRAKGMDDLSDFGRSVPSLAYRDSNVYGYRGERVLVIRGISDTEATGYYLDESFLPPIDPKLFDINRIEVLRGPQSTLYGASSLGGTVKIVTNQPEPGILRSDVDVSVMTTEKGEESYHANGMVNIPLLDDKAALRVVGSYRSEGGFIDNLPNGVLNDPDEQRNYNDEESYTIRASLKFVPNDRLTITPNILIQRSDADGLREHLPETLGDLKTSHRLIAPNDGKEDVDFYNLTWSYDFDGARLLSSTTYHDELFTGREDADPFLLAIFGFVPPTASETEINQGVEAFSQELRLTSMGEGRLQWQLGAWYRDSERTFDLDWRHPGLSALFGLPGLIPGDIIVIDNSILDNEQYAFYADLTYALTEKLTVSAGVRYFHNKVDFSTSTIGLLSGGVAPFTGGSSEDGVRPKFFASYQITEEAMVYGHAAQGFRTGGVNRALLGTCAPDLAALGLTFQDVQEFESDSVWNYELGAKTSWFNSKLIANLAVFHMEWDDVQQTVSLPCGDGFIANVGKATTTGFELEAAAILVEGLELSAGISYNDAQLDKDDPTSGGMKGDPLPNSPEWILGFSGQYTFPFPAFDGLDMFIRGDYQFFDKTVNTFDISNNPLESFPSYDQANFRIGLVGNTWTASLFINNAFDERPKISITQLGALLGDPQFTTMRPRTIGLNISKSFN